MRFGLTRRPNLTSVAPRDALRKEQNRRILKPELCDNYLDTYRGGADRNRPGAHFLDAGGEVGLQAHNFPRVAAACGA